MYFLLELIMFQLFYALSSWFQSSLFVLLDNVGFFSFSFALKYVSNDTPSSQKGLVTWNCCWWFSEFSFFPCEWEIDHFQVIMAVIDQIPPPTQAQKEEFGPKQFLLGSFYTAGIHDWSKIRFHSFMDLFRVLSYAISSTTPCCSLWLYIYIYIYISHTFPSLNTLL